MQSDGTPATDRLVLRAERLEIGTKAERNGERDVTIDVRRTVARRTLVSVYETLDVRTQPVVPPRPVATVDLQPQRLVVTLSRERSDVAKRAAVYEEAAIRRVGVVAPVRVEATLRRDELVVGEDRS